MGLELQNIPEELKALPQWVVREGKKPLIPATGKGASAGKPDSWDTFAHAVQAMERGRYDGIGFEFHHNGIVGIDLDTVRDPATGWVDPVAEAIINQVASYTEISPSGYGFHIYCKGDVELEWNKAPLPPNQIKRPELDGSGKQKTGPDGAPAYKTPEIELYNQGRYFTVTGNRFGEHTGLRECPQAVRELQRAYARKREKPTPQVLERPVTPATSSGGRKDYLQIGLEKDSRFQALWNGSGRTGDESRDDLSLMNKLAYWCSGDEQAMTQAFQASPYWGQKDQKHLKKADRRDYLHRTAVKALADCAAAAARDDAGFQWERKQAEQKRAASPDNWETPAKEPTSPSGNPSEEASPYSKLFEGTSYFIQNNCFYRKYKKNDEDMEQYLSNFIIVAEAETVRDNGIDHDRIFRLKAVCEGKELPSADIPAKDFSSMNFIPQTWGMALRPGVGQNTLAYIRDSISAQARNIKQEYIYTHTGWRKIDGKWAFLHAGGAVGAEEVRVELDGRLSRYALSPCLDKRAAAQTALDLFQIAPKETILPLVGLAFLSPLNEFLRQAGIEPSFVLYLLGSTGAMKSTIAALVLSFFGRFDNKSLPESFKDTANSLEKQGFLLKDVLTVVDDYHPTGSAQEARKMQATAQAVARMYGDRTGRGRMNADATLKQSYIPRGNAIITGEDLPDIGQSGIARNIIVPVEKGSLNKEALTALQDNSECLSGCMTAYLEWLEPQADALPQELKRQFTALRKAAAADGRHGRTTEATAHLQIGMLYFIQFLNDCGVLDEGLAEGMRRDSWDTLLAIADRQSRQIEQEKPTVLFLDAFQELLDTGATYVIDLDKAQPGEHYTPSAGFVGYKDKDYFYLHADTAFQYVVQFYKAQDRHFPVKKNALLKQLAAEGLSEPDTDKNRNVKQKKINGKNQNFLWLVNSETPQAQAISIIRTTCTTAERMA